MAAYIEDKHRSGATLLQLRDELLRLQELIRLNAYDVAAITSRQLAGDILRNHSDIAEDIDALIENGAEEDKDYMTNFVRIGETYELY